MRIIGVTGGVGSGKSAVLNYLEEHFDSRVVKADEVGHLLMMPGRECYEPIIELFGEWVVKRTPHWTDRPLPLLFFSSRIC